MIDLADVADRFGLEFAVSLSLEELTEDWAPRADLRDRKEALRIVELVAKVFSSS